MARFGLSQRHKPTPERVNLIAKVLTGAIGIFIGWTSTNDIIPPKTENVLTSILGLILLLIPVMLPLFGTDVQGKTVPTEQVTGIDTDKPQN